MSKRSTALLLAGLYGAGGGLAVQGMRDAFGAGHPWLALLCAVCFALFLLLIWRNMHRLKQLQGGQT
ncbi:hypothetical protein GCM10017783_23520 [Deinococcus piscis]|uniref:Uncharacterized protein n=1 Tax=Deinococcus piscis TaxID=394230 RepID=A0ABQ3KH10_9DEIO|nr:hypothetical protein [Deinococcus piscis]GHG10360.1 hypothetical protein GCM10017783_23520 [Deinococcus piscis]